MNTFIENLITNYGAISIVFLVALENIFPPIPSELILLFGGFVTTTTKMSIFTAIIASTIGAVLGALLLYYIGSLLTKERLNKFCQSKLGKIMHLKINDIQKAENSFQKFGNFSVLIGRFIPIVRSLISLPAGMIKMPLGSFILFTTIGTLIWNSLLIKLGQLAGKNWHHIENIIDQFSWYILIGVIILIIIYIFIKKGRKK